MGQELPRVLVGAPITEDLAYKPCCLDEYFRVLGSLTYEKKSVSLLLNGAGGDDLIDEWREFNVARTATYSSRIKTVVNARNSLRESAISEGFDYLFFLEQDIIPPPNVIERLIGSGKTVCSALYFNDRLNIVQRRTGEMYPMAWAQSSQRLANGSSFIDSLDPLPITGERELKKAAVCGLGVVVIHREVLNLVSFRSDEGWKIFEEFLFGQDCRESGIEIFVDTGVVCQHVTPSGLLGPSDTGSCQRLAPSF